MKRRDLLRLAGAGGILAALPWRAEHRAAAGFWRFHLDRDLRWSLEGGERTVFRGASVAVELAGAAIVPLGELESPRSMRTGGRNEGAWTVVGRVRGVEITAQFTDGAFPTIRVRARGLDEPRDLVALHFSDGAFAPGRFVWINGYASGSPCQIAPVGEVTGVAGHWQIAFLGGQELAMAFGSGDDGAGEFRLEGVGVSAVSRFGRRTLGAESPPVACTLTIVPGSDPLEALGRLAEGAAGPGRTSAAALSGWCACRGLAEAATEDDVLRNLEVVRREFDPRAFRVVQLDAGYQRALGDWETNAAFPNGHRWLTDRIHAAGLDAALWLAPFAVAEASGLASEHPEWLLKGPGGQPLVEDHGPPGGGPAYVLDGSVRGVQDWLRGLTRRAVSEWGYDHLALAFPAEGARRGLPQRGAGPVEALRAGLRALREGAGRAFILGGGGPLQHALGQVDAMRVGPDVSGAWRDVEAAARGTLLRAHLGGRAWLDDPDALIVGAPLTLEEARAWASVCALSGGVIRFADPLPGLAGDRLDILRRTIPAPALLARAADLTADAVVRGRAPSWMVSQSRDDWWMLAAVNWEDMPARLEADLATLGLRGPLAAYDVWGESRFGDVPRTLTLDLPAHGALVLGLRRTRQGPFVLGTTRHIVQGMVDLQRERWDPRRRVLSGLSAQLDGRPYAITIQVPPGMHPRRCGASTACEAVHPHDGDLRTMRLEFAAPPPEVEWEVGF
jgi:alpha-galactosidase